MEISTFVSADNHSQTFMEEFLLGQTNHSADRNGWRIWNQRKSSTNFIGLNFSRKVWFSRFENLAESFLAKTGKGIFGLRILFAPRILSKSFRFLVLKISWKVFKHLESEILTETEKGILQLEKICSPREFRESDKKSDKYLPKNCILQTESKSEENASG